LGNANEMSLLSAMLVAMASSFFGLGRIPSLPRGLTIQARFTSRRRNCGAKADGRANDSAAIQAAIDKAAGDAHEGIVFVPSGRYLLTRTVYVWPESASHRLRRDAARSSCWRTTRRVFQKGVGDMVVFTGNRPGARSGASGRISVSTPRAPFLRMMRLLTPVPAHSIQR